MLSERDLLCLHKAVLVALPFVYNEPSHQRDGDDIIAIKF